MFWVCSQRSEIITDVEFFLIHHFLYPMGPNPPPPPTHTHTYPNGEGAIKLINHVKLVLIIVI